MPIKSTLYSHNSDEWETPQALFDEYDSIFDFDLDACATPENAKCSKYYTIKDDGLAQEWRGVVWCNPPYSQVAKWVKKAYESSHRGGHRLLCSYLREPTRNGSMSTYGHTRLRSILSRGVCGSVIQQTMHRFHPWL